MYIKRKLKLGLFIFSVIGIVGLFAPDIIFAQYDYYDSYSNSNIDYFPTNPINTSPSRTQSSGTIDGTSGGTSGGTTSGGTTNTTTTTTPCANRPKVNPQNTRSVEIRDKGGKVFYLSPPKEELIGIKAYPETSLQIFKIIYGASNMQESEYVIGLITVNNQCYPKYGYVQDNAVTTPKTSPSVLPPSNTQNMESTTVPENATAVNLNPVTGKAYNAKTGELINDARYDATMRKIYYKDSDSTFGKVFTDTTGYVNIDLRGLVNTSASPLPSPLKVDSYKMPVQTPARTAGDIDRDSAVDKKAPPTSPSGITGSDSGMGELSDKIINDSDLNILNIDIGGDDLEKLRTEVLTIDTTKKTTVRGWDPKQKEEIVGHPEVVKTSEDLRIYTEAVALSDAALKGITVKGGMLKLESQEQGKLFWFIPVELSSRVTVDFKSQDSIEDRVSVKFPWWHVFVKKNFSSDTFEKELAKELSGVFNPSKWEKVDNSETPTNMSRVARALNLVLNVLKTKHDTVKNSISNVR